MAFALVMLLSTASRSQVIQNLATGGTASLDGLTFTVSGCGSSSTAGLCSNVMLDLSASRGIVTAEFVGNGGAYGSNVLSVSNGSLQYLWFNLSVASTGSRAVTSLSGSVGGYGYNNTQVMNAASGCSVSGGWNTGSYCAAYAYNYPVSTGNATQTVFSGMTSLSVSYTLGIQGSAGQTLVLNRATSLYSVPEPSTAALLLTGMAGLLCARRWRRRRAARACRAGGGEWAR
jgi:hypothetical protein